MAVMREARLVACGLVLILGAAALFLLRAPVSLSAFTLTFGAGVIASSRALLHSARTRAAVLGVFVVAFVAYRLGALVGTGFTALEAVALVVQAAMLAIMFALGHDHAHGLSQLVALLRRNNAGYAPVIDERVAARTVEAELARSRRHGTPLTFLLLEPSSDGADGSDGPVGEVGEMEGAAGTFHAAVRPVSQRALSELERIYARNRACMLISEHVRRSDVVVAWEDRFLVVSADTSAEGTAILAARIFEAARRELGLPLRTGMAAFPLDGSTYSELIAVATAAARGGGNGHGDVHGVGAIAADGVPAVPSDDYEPPTVPHAQASQ